MKAYDIINQLFVSLPSQTSLFSDSVSITSLSKVGTTVTAVSTAPHGLTTGKYVYIGGASRKTPVSTLTSSNGVATAATSVAHDLTEKWVTDVTLIGADQPQYNSSHALLSVPNRYTFTFTVNSGITTPATGTISLLEPLRRGFNGWYQITVINTTTFTYTSEDTYTANAYGTMYALTSPRISGALTLNKAVDCYSKFGQNKLWAFVVMGDAVASKDRHSYQDAIASHTTGSTFRQQILNNIDIYVFVPTKDSLSGRAERDTISDVAKYLYKCLLGRTYPTGFVDEPTAVLHFLRHGVQIWNHQFYVHKFSFEAMTDITKNDVVDPDYTRAFRDIELDNKNADYNNLIMQTNIDLDDVLS